MEYKINFNEWGSMFSVPQSVVDKHLKLANETQLKVILYILKNSHSLPQVEEISENLSININEVENAINFWIDRKILYQNIFETEEVKVKVSKPVKVQHKHDVKPDPHFVAMRLREDKNLAGLLDDAQLALSKTLSSADISTLVYLYDTNGLPCEVILLMIHYCVSVGKGNMHSIEKMGLEWADEEIFSLEQAEDKIKELSSRDNSWMVISRLFKLKNASKPTKKQLEYAHTWLNVWKFSKEMINEAYERCINAKNELSMSYINAILKKLYEKNIKTISQLKEYEQSTFDKRKAKSAKTKEKGSVYSSDSASYNLDEYEKKSLFD